MSHLIEDGVDPLFVQQQVGTLVGIDHGDVHDGRAGRAEPDAAVRAGPRIRGGRGVTGRKKKVGYRWHLRRLMADKDITPRRNCGRCWPSGASRCHGSRSTGW
jgi:hypothetical protein